MDSRNNPLARKTDIVEQELKGELLIYDLTINKAFCLNETSAPETGRKSVCLLNGNGDGSIKLPQIGEKLNA